MNKQLLLSITLLLTMPAFSKANYTSTRKIKPYKEFLEKGTYESFGNWPKHTPLPKSRYYTFKKSFEHFEKTDGHVIVELGTTRSFTHGGHEGCCRSDTKYWMPNQPEWWDWGAGSFTRVAAEALGHMQPEFHTIDLNGRHMNICKTITQEFPFMQYHVCSSVDFLRACNFKIDLLYLDTGNITPIEPTAQLHLQEAQVIVERDIIAPNGIILIDDVRNQAPKLYGETSQLGKAKYSLPYLLENGFELVEDEYQVILRKK